MARRLIAGSLIMFGMIIAQFGAFVWWVDREVIDPERLATVATTVVRDEEFRAAVAPEIADRLIAENDTLSAVADRDLIISAVNTALNEPAVIDVVGRAVGDLTAVVLGTSDEVVTIDLDELHVATVELLREVNPQLATQLEEFPTPAPIELDASRFPDLAGPRSIITIIWMMTIGVGASIALLGVLIHPRPARGIRRVGMLLAIGGAIQLGLAWVTAEVIATNLPDNGIAAAGGIGLRVMLDGWRVQAVVQIVAGGSVAVGGQLLGWIPNLAHRVRPAPA